MGRVFLPLIFLCTGFYSNAQVPTQSPADTLETHIRHSLVAYYKKYPQEKIFLHTSQPLYSSGETIWYKAYAMAYGKPSALSKIIYVQLTDTAGNVIVQNKLPLTGGLAHGNIELSEKIKSGWYGLSAFTSWMMNFDRETWYRQQIYISNPNDLPVGNNRQPTAKKRYHIAFYPEGGDLILGAMSKIAFRTVDDEGGAVTVNGVIKDNTNAEVARLQTRHDGMGECVFEATGNSYSATIQFPDGSQQKVKLPDVKKEGISLQAGQTKTSVLLKLVFAGPKEKFENCILAASQNSGQVVTNQLKLAGGINLYQLPANNFSTGILRLTVFDHEGIPLAERILFINKHDLAVSSLKADTLSFSAGAKNAFSLTIKDQDEHPVKGNFSVAITDGDAFSKDEEGQDIFSAVLLTPELKGVITDPGYYFKNQSDSLANQLDLVMLTHGWRHFSWQKLLNNEDYKIRYPMEQSQFIAGSVAYPKHAADDPKMNIKLLVMNQDSTKFVGYIIPDSLGRFILKNFNHTGRSDVYLQAADKKDHPLKVVFKLFPAPGDSLKQAKADSFAPPETPYLLSYYLSAIKGQAANVSFMKGIMLNTVNVKEKKLTPTEKLIAEHASAKYVSDREFTLDLVNNPTLNIGLVDYINGRFPGLQIVGRDPDIEFIYRGRNTLMMSSGAPGTPASGKSTGNSSSSNLPQPYFYLDEAPVVFDDIKDIDLTEVALIRFMPPPVWFAPYNGGNVGAIMVYTKKQSDEVRKMNGVTDYDHFIFNGYSITREFSEPDFVKLKHAGLTDTRTTLYWNHDLETDARGILKFSFHNSGRAKTFRVIIQGMDNEGRLADFEQSIAQ